MNKKLRRSIVIITVVVIITVCTSGIVYAWVGTCRHGYTANGGKFRIGNTPYAYLEFRNSHVGNKTGVTLNVRYYYNGNSYNYNYSAESNSSYVEVTSGTLPTSNFEYYDISHTLC